MEIGNNEASELRCCQEEEVPDPGTSTLDHCGGM